MIGAALWTLGVCVATQTGAAPDPSLHTPDLLRDPLEAEAEAAGRDPTVHDFRWVILPNVAVNSDEGVGGGVILALHHFHGGVAPLRDDLSVRLYMTSRLIQRHELRWEGLNVFDLPLRLWTRVGYFSTLTQTFCGVGNGVTCDDDVARAAAADVGLHEGSVAYDDFVRRYYQMRYIKPYADTVMRWRVHDKPVRVEIMNGWRLAWHIPGDLFERGPWPDSLYARVHPDGEAGVSSVPQIGVVVDTRDDEPAPTRGIYSEASLRGGHPLWGSTWTWAGINTSVSGYDVVLPSPRVVYGGRVLVDLAAGDMATEDIAAIGGTRDYGAFGGQWIGRGVRDRRYLGKLKVIHQSELRTDLFSFTAFRMRFDIGWVVFGDVGWIGYDWNNITGRFPNDPWRAGTPLGLVYGGGVGLRAVVNRAIVGRVELAASPLEQRSPAVYTPVGNSL